MLNFNGLSSLIWVMVIVMSPVLAVRIASQNNASVIAIVFYAIGSLFTGIAIELVISKVAPLFSPRPLD